MPQENTFTRIYALVKKIPRGQVTTYGQIALLLGNPRMSRIVGGALHTCKEDVPWQRVVNRAGGLSVAALSPESAALQRALLEAEGVPFTPDGRVDLRRCMWYGED